MNIIKKISQKIVCCSTVTDVIAYLISKTYFSKIGKYEPKNIPCDGYKKYIGKIGIYFPNFFFNTYMFYPKDENFGIVVNKYDMVKIKKEQ